MGKVFNVGERRRAQDSGMLLSDEILRDSQNPTCKEVRILPVYQNGRSVKD
jgi:hypothetical protein